MSQSPETTCRSEWHTPAAVMVTSTSLDCGFASSTSVKMGSDPGASNRIAFIDGFRGDVGQIGWRMTGWQREAYGTQLSTSAVGSAPLNFVAECQTEQISSTVGSK